MLDDVVADLVPSLLKADGALRPGYDDCGVVELPGGGRLVISTDLVNASPAFVELGIGEPFHTRGWLATTANLSDVYSAGARPVALVLTLAGPPDEMGTALPAFITGARDAAAPHGVPIVGGDTKGAKVVGAGATGVGYLAPGDSYLARWDARPGDDLYLTAPLGGFNAAVVLVALGGPERAEAEGLITSPVLATNGLLVLSRSGARGACIDVSDGLAVDAGRLAAASSVTVSIDITSVPLSPLTGPAASLLGTRPEAFALATGGEWSHLVATDPASGSILARNGAVRIGCVRDGNGSVEVVAGLEGDRSRPSLPIPPVGHSDGAFASFSDEIVALVRSSDERLRVLR